MIVRARATFLGTGTSHGVPMIGCRCATCLSTDPKDTRLRPSLVVDVPGRARVLIDTSTDLRQQALTHGLTHIDAILFTHAHADHIMGLDDVRRFNVMQGGAIPCYADAVTWESITHTFHYVFDGLVRQGGGIPSLERREVAGPFSVAGVHVIPVPLLHGTAPILGYRFGSFAYLTDCSAIPDGSWPLLVGVDTLVIDALRERPHPTHFTLDQAIAAARRIGASRTCFTHMCHDLPHAQTCARLPAGMELAYDGQELDVSVEVE